MIVVLESVGNPDFGQDPDRPMWGCTPNHAKVVKTFKEASEACVKFIDDNELGGGNWSGGLIKKNGKAIANVSYNGRVWEGTTGWTPDTKEIKI